MTDRDIQKNRLKKLLKEADESASNKLIMDYDDAIDDNADYLLANGVVKVVRCKDCRRCYINSFGKESNTGVCNKKGVIGTVVQLDDFCSYGELKECEGK